MDDRCGFHWRILCLTAVFATLCGCSSSDRPEIGTVTGTLTLDGQPLPQAIVYFTPEGGGRPSTAITDDAGRYELVYMGDVKGAKVGTHTVRCSTAREVEDAQGKATQAKELVPEKYRDESQLKIDVVPGPQVHDLTLTSQ